LGGTGKAEDAKLPGAGIIPKRCPMERVEWRQWNKTGLIGIWDEHSHRKGKIADRLRLAGFQTDSSS